MATSHVVEQGECLASIAARYGVSDYKTIYDAPENEELRRKRPNPNLLHPGDVVAIPDLKQKKVPCATGGKHKFQLDAPLTRLRIALQDDDGIALANKKYSLRVRGRVIEGTTDGDGLLEQTIPASVTEGELRVFLGEPGETEEGYLFPLEIGSLGPSEGASGIKARLENLGFDCGEGEDEAGERIADAVAAFQSVQGLPVTGQLDDSTIAKLRQQHDGE